MAQKRRRARKEVDWPRDLASVPTLSRLSAPRRVDCRKCRKIIAADQAHFGVTYRGRYGRATSHLCACCAAKYLRQVYNATLLMQIQRGIDAVHKDHGASCPECLGASASAGKTPIPAKDTSKTSARVR